MKAVIVYFSQTGNTKQIAEAICAGLKTTLKDTDMIPIKSAAHTDFCGYDLIGIGCPVWGLKEPKIVSDFIKNLKNISGKQAFVFCTHATITGGFFNHILPQMDQKGMIVIGWNDWFAGNVNPTVESPYYTDGHPDEADLTEARIFGAEMASRFLSVIEGGGSTIPRIEHGEAYDRRYGNLEAILRNVKRSEGSYSKAVFEFNGMKCNHCSLCKTQCPTESIDLEKEKVLDESTCAHCHFCELICPTGAIAFPGKLHIDRNNPSSLAIMDDLMANKELRRFRPLVDFDKVASVAPEKEMFQNHPYLILREGIGVLPPKRNK